MFSQLTALAKSATDFSLDNLQEKEDDSETTTASIVNTSDQSSTLPANRSEQGQGESANPLKDNSPPDQSGSMPLTDPSATDKAPAVSSITAASSFTNLFKSKPPTTDEKAVPSAPSAGSMTSSFNQLLDYGFSGKTGSGSTSSTSETTSTSTKKDHSKSKIEQEPAASDAVKDVKDVNQRDTATASASSAVSMKEQVESSSPSKSTKTPPKAKKGSGREAARLLEMQLRATVSDLEANLHEKISQLEQVNRCREQEVEDMEKLRSEMSILKGTVSELEENNIDLVTQNEELDREVNYLQQEVRQLKEQTQDLAHRKESMLIDSEKSVDHKSRDGIEAAQKQVSEESTKAEADVERLRISLEELQQSLSTQASKHKTQLKSLEKKAKSKVATATEKAEVLAAEVAILKEKLVSQVAETEAERSNHQTTVKEIKDAHLSNLSELDEEKSALEQSVEQLEEEKKALSTLLEQAKEEKSSLQASMEQQLRDVVEDSSGEATAKEVKLIELQDQCSDLREQLNASETAHNQLKEKFTSFTEKTKVQVKKFIESQKVADEEKRQAAANLEARESEITSLRLKLETVDHTLSDRKALSSELAERYSELQRDMQRKLEELSSKDAFAEDLQRSISDQKEQIASLNARLTDGEAALEEAQRQSSTEVAALHESFTSTLQDERDKIERLKKERAAAAAEAERQMEALLEESDSLRLQVSSLQEQVDKGVGSKKTLEEYKLRAQKAVKQANTTSAAVSAKLSEAEESVGILQAQLSAAESRIVELQSSIHSAEQALDKERKDHKDKLSGIETKSFELQNEVLTLKSNLDTAIADAEKVKMKNEQLTTLLEERRREVQQQESLEQVVGGKNKAPTPNKVVKSSLNKTAVVVPVRRAPNSASSLAASNQSLKSENLGKSSEYYSNDSDCVLVKGETLDYVEVDANAQSDMESGGNVSENSSVVVQWKNIMHRPNVTGNNSPNSDSADNCSPTKNAALGLAGGKLTHRDVDDGDADDDDVAGGRVSKVESMLTIPSCSSDNSLLGHEDADRYESGKGSGEYFFVNELKKELHRLRQEVASCHMVAEDLRRNSTVAEEERVKAVQDYNELKAFHERTKRLLSSPDSATNIEYLKKCVFRLMVTKEVSERSRLYPVISMLLKFTPAETREVTSAIQDEVAASDYTLGSSASWLTASSTLGGLFGGGGAVHGTITSTGEVVSDETMEPSAPTTESSSSSWW